MSVTFFFPDAPTKVIHPYDDEPDYEETAYVEPFFDINMSNMNAVDFLRLVDPTADTDELCGEWTPEHMPRLISRTMRLLNTTPEQFTAEPFRDGNVYTCGRDLDYVTQRLTAFLDMFKLAQEHKMKIVFG